MTQRVVLLLGPRKGGGLMSEVPLHGLETGVEGSRVGVDCLRCRLGLRDREFGIGVPVHVYLSGVGVEVQFER